MVSSRNYLVPSSGGYYLLPDVSCSQEEHGGFIKGRGSLKVKLIGQQDGSRIKWLSSPTLGAVDLARKIEEYFPDSPEVWTCADSGPGVLEAYLRNDWLVYRYIGIWTHSFLNGARVVPLIVCEGAGVFYDASVLFSDKIPSDEFGVLVDFDDDGPLKSELSLSEFGCSVELEIIKYFAYKRMCHCCGVVSDVSQVRKRPWASPAKLG